MASFGCPNKAEMPALFEKWAKREQWKHTVLSSMLWTLYDDQILNMIIKNSYLLKYCICNVVRRVSSPNSMCSFFNDPFQQEIFGPSHVDLALGGHFSRLILMYTVFTWDYHNFVSSFGMFPMLLIPNLLFSKIMSSACIGIKFP